MTDKRKMRYNPSLSVRENARNNGTTEDAVRYFIRSMHIDRRYERKVAMMEDILREEDFCRCILEPFCGSGTMSEAIRAHGYEVESSDIVDRGYGEVRDFFSADFEPGKCDIITNPPYAGDLAGIVSRCIGLCRRKVAMLMPLGYLSGRDRHRNIYGKLTLIL